MQRRIETYCSHDGKELKLTKRNEFMTAIFSSFKEGKRLKIIVEDLFKKRSNEQNSYYWGVIIDKYLQGNEETEGRKLCTEIVNRTTGEILYIPLSEKEAQDKAHDFLKLIFNNGKSTQENSTTDQEVYHVFCREYIKFAFNIDVELPNENLKMPL